MPDHGRLWYGREYFIHDDLWRWLRDNEVKVSVACGHADILAARHEGQTAFVLCPGPSLGNYTPQQFAGKLTIAVNSAAFYAAPRYWCIVEGRYVTWAIREQREGGLARFVELLRNSEYVMSLRAAAGWMRGGLPSRRIWITRHEEDGAVPKARKGRESATMNAIATARLMGFRRVVLIGMDLSKPHGLPYVAGVPYSPHGAKSDYGRQAAVFRSITFSGIEVLNASPFSAHFDIGIQGISEEQAMQMLAEAPEVKP